MGTQKGRSYICAGGVWEILNHLNHVDTHSGHGRQCLGHVPKGLHWTPALIMCACTHTLVQGTQAYVFLLMPHVQTFTIHGSGTHLACMHWHSPGVDVSS